MITTWNILAKDFEKFTSLETFHVSANNLATQDVRWISGMTSLNRLNLSSAWLEDTWIAPLTNLTKLNIYAPEATKMAEKRLINTLCRSLTRMEILHLVDFSHLGASSIDPLTTLSHLRMLTICTRHMKNPKHLMSLTSLVSLVYFKYRNTDDEADDTKPPANLDQVLRALRQRSPYAIRYQVSPGNDVRVY